MRRLIVLHSIIVCICHFSALGQNGLAKTVAAIDSVHKEQPSERLYVQLDKGNYMSGDTIWYKAYLLNEKLSASLKSGLLYVELANDSNRVFKRQTLTVQNGIAAGDIALKMNWPPGNYTLRAYTNWMRNFDPGNFFFRKIRIVPSGSQHWIVDNNITFDKEKNVSMALHFSDLTPKNLGFRDIQLSVLNGSNVLLKRKMLTDPHGNLSFRFALPEKNLDKQLSVLVEDMGEDAVGQQLIIPLELNRFDNTDLQFMPEGGALLAGLQARVGFKAIGEDGRAIAIKGQVYSNNKREVASFQATHKGMGSFLFTPLAGESYTAKVVFTDGTTKNYALPAVKNTGISIQAKNVPDKDSVELQIVATPDLLNNNNIYYLIGQGRDKVYYGESIVFSGKPITKKVAKSLFATGVIKFTLYEASKQAVTRRMLFIDHADQLSINVSSNKANYLLKDSVSLQLLVTDATGKPVEGNFSLAVTDDNKIKATDTNEENIESKMLLNSDLKGSIEEPSYYFRKENADRAEALDNLLLTQGWVDYTWKQIFGPPEKPKYDPETQFRVTGLVNNIFNKPIANIEVVLDSDYPLFTLTARTDKYGHFVFNDFPPLEKIDFRLHTAREFNIAVIVDELVPPEFSANPSHKTPWYINTDSIMISYITNKFKNDVVNTVKLKPEDVPDLITSNKVLKTVTIRGRYLKKPPPLQLLMDEEDVRNARTGSKALNLMQLLNQNEKINHMYKLLVVDEASYIPFKDIASIEGQQDINQWLKAHTTEDIVDMRVERIFITTKLGETPTLAVGIHTNGSKGAEITAGNYYYRPIPISQPHQFYSPRYAVKSTDKDKRSTIFWSANIITDTSGKANVSFYTADLPGTYTLILEGSDMNGKVGYKKHQIKVAGR